MKRFISFTFCVIWILNIISLITGCNKEAPEIDTRLKTVLNKHGKKEDKKNLKGRTFNFLSWFEVSQPKHTDEETDIYAEDFYNLQKTYNFKINYTYIPLEKYYEELITDLMSGKEKYDLMWIRSSILYPELVVNEMLMPLDDIKYLNFNEPKWDPFIKEMSTYENKTYGMYPGRIQAQQVLFFNKTLLVNTMKDLPEAINNDIQVVESTKPDNPEATPDSLKLPESVDLYRLTDEKKWDWKEFTGLLSNFSEKNMDENITLLGGNIRDQLIFSNNTTYMDINKKGKASLSLNSANTVYALKFYKELMNKGFYSGYDVNVPWGEDLQEFVEGNMLFYAGEYWESETYMRKEQMEDEYGVILFPKGPNADDYKSLSYQTVMVSVPQNAKNPDDIGLAYDLFTEFEFLHNKYDISERYEKMTRDEESARNLDNISKYGKFIYNYNGFVENFQRLVDSFFYDIEKPGASIDNTLLQYMPQLEKAFMD